MVLALMQWYPLVSGWRGIWTGWPWGVAGNWVCVETETEESGPVRGTGSMQSGWGGFGRYVTAGIPTTSLLALRLKHSESTSQHYLPSLLR